MKTPGRSIIYFSLALVVAGLSSCRVAYTPNNQNVPMFREAGEVRANLGTRNAQVAGAVTDNIAVMVNGQRGVGRWESLDFDEFRETHWRSERWLLEGGAGLYRPIDDYGSAEIYAGMGFGEVRFNRIEVDEFTTEVLDIERFSGKFQKYFIQPSISATWDVADVGFSMRFVGLNFTQVDTLGYTINELQENELANLNRGMHYFVEPALTLRLGWRYVKFNTQLGYAVKMSNVPLNHNPFIFTFGLSFHAAPRWFVTN